MILEWFLVLDAWLQIFTFLPILLDSVGEVVQVVLLAHQIGVLLRGPIRCVGEVFGISLC